MTVAVVGGGVAGTSVAWALARRGAAPLLLEAERRGTGGASAVPAALLNPYRGRAGHAHPEDVAGLEATLRWADALRSRGLDPGLHPGGVLRIPTSARQARSWARRAWHDGTASASWWTAEVVPEPYHAPFGALRVRHGGWLRPYRWLAALAHALRQDGGRLRQPARVVGCEERARSVRLRLASGDTVDAEHVVWCVGAHACPDARAPAFEARAGDVATLDGAPPFPCPVAGPTYGIHEGEETAFVGGHHRAPDETPADAGTRLRDWFARAVPALAAASVRETWHGVRAHAADARPVVLDLSPRSHVVGAFGGRGFLCAAHVAERFAEALVARRAAAGP